MPCKCVLVATPCWRALLITRVLPCSIARKLQEQDAALKHKLGARSGASARGHAVVSPLTPLSANVQPTQHAAARLPARPQLQLGAPGRSAHAAHQPQAVHRGHRLSPSALGEPLGSRSELYMTELSGPSVSNAVGATDGYAAPLRAGSSGKRSGSAQRGGAASHDARSGLSQLLKAKFPRK